MSDGDALLAAIVADPDDLPRLAYADWLHENGEPDRAEFIRTQIEAARLPALARHWSRCWISPPAARPEPITLGPPPAAAAWKLRLALAEWLPPPP